MWSVMDHLLFHFLKYFPHTSFGSQNQIYINVNIVIDNTKFKVTRNWQKILSRRFASLEKIKEDSSPNRLKWFTLKQVQIPVNLSQKCN